MPALPVAALPRLPDAVLALLDRLREAGHETYLVGGCVRDLLRGKPVRDFDVATSAPPEALLALFPHAIPIGLRHGTVMVPTPSGPVDVTRFRSGDTLETDLAHRDFTVNALAWDPRGARLVDPHGGREDLAAGRLRAVGSARERFAEDPLRALRAARFVATLPVEADAALEAAMADAAEDLLGVARERLREELSRLLLGPRAGAGLALLRRTGLEARLAPGAQADAAAVVAALPAELSLRLAGWLRGASAAAICSRLGFGRARTTEVEALLRRHPLERNASPELPASLRRLLARAGTARVQALFALREAELAAGGVPVAVAAGARARLAALREALARVLRDGKLALERQHLAVTGEGVMALLGCAPGPRIGRALAHLTECVIEDPSANTPERLRALLLEWDEQGKGARAAGDPRG